MADKIEYMVDVIANKLLYDDSVKGEQSTGYKIYSVVPTQAYKDKIPINSYGNFTISGVMPTLIKNKKYSISCTPDVCSKYPCSYKLVQIETELNPNPTKEETVIFLEGIGLTHSVVQSIIDTYPNIIKLIIDDKVDEIDLNKINGVGKKRLESIKTKVQENYCLLGIINEFKDYELSMSVTRQLHSKYKNVEVIKEMMNINPYGCLCSLAGVGFKRADEKILNSRPDLSNSQYRMVEGMLYTLEENEKNGNTWITIEELYDKCNELVPESMEHFENCLKNSPEIYVEYISQRVAKEETRRCEVKIADRIHTFLNAKKNYHFDTTKYEYSRDGDKLTDTQKSILPLLNTESIIILAGYAGTGKSTSMKAVVDMLMDNDKSILQTATTGRASRVLKDMTGQEAHTIQKILHGFNVSVKGESSVYPIEQEFVICDEASMLDIWLMEEMMYSMNPERTTVIFVCDPAQLPSVGAGNIVTDMIDSGIIPTVFLTEVFRYKEQGLSYIATKTRDGEQYLNSNNYSIQTFGKNNDYTFIPCSNEDMTKTLVQLYRGLLNKGIDANDIIVLIAQNKGNLGTITINNLLQIIANPKPEGGCLERTIDNQKVKFRKGDRVLQTVNNYHAQSIIREFCEIGQVVEEGEIPIFNGDDAIIYDVSNEGMTLDIGNKEYLINYTLNDVNNLILGYSVSIHKSQGSSYENVIILSPSSHIYNTTRNLLYVAVTRAKKKVWHLGSMKTINIGLKKATNVTRRTFLCGLLVNHNE